MIEPSRRRVGAGAGRPSLVGTILRTAWWGWLPSIYVGDFMALAGGWRDPNGIEHSSVPWGVTGFVAAFLALVGLVHRSRVRRHRPTSTSSVPHHRVTSVDVSRSNRSTPTAPALNYEALLSELHGWLGSRVRVTVVRWPDADPGYSYLIGFLRGATQGWERISRTTPSGEATGFLVTASPDGEDEIGGFIISSAHLTTARLIDDNTLGIRIRDIMVGVARENTARPDDLPH
jgi:hypothetical protein